MTEEWKFTCVDKYNKSGIGAYDINTNFSNLRYVENLCWDHKLKAQTWRVKYLKKCLKLGFKVENGLQLRKKIIRLFIYL